MVCPVSQNARLHLVQRECTGSTPLSTARVGTIVIGVCFPSPHTAISTLTVQSGVQYGQGLLGPIIIDGPATENYDEDLGFFTLTDWYNITAFYASSYGTSSALYWPDQRHECQPERFKQRRVLQGNRPSWQEVQSPNHQHVRGQCFHGLARWTPFHCDH